MKVQRIHISIAGLIFLSVFGLSSSLFAQDYQRLSERTIAGTARYVGMCGAMTAIGGDPTAANDNPAGLGLYRRSEVMFTIDEATDYTIHSLHAPCGSERTWRVTLPQASWVISIDNYKDQGVAYNNLMLSYRRLHTFNRYIRTFGADGESLGALLAETEGTPGSILGINYPVAPHNRSNYLTLDEAGYVGEYSLDWAMNISHRLYLGLGLRLQSFSFGSLGTYYEQYYQTNADGIPYDIEDSSSLIMSGTTCSMAFGIIYRPVQWARIGFSLHTPSIGSTNTGTYGSTSAMTDSLRCSIAGDLFFSSKDFHMPLHISTGVAFQLKNIGMLSFQYDYLHQKHEKYGLHSLRAGLEVIPVGGMYINAGYAYESTFNKQDRIVGIDPTLDRCDTYFQHTQSSQYASIALGYRGYYCIAQLAYQYRWQKINLYAHENVSEPYRINTDTHRVVVTLSWHRENP